MADTVTTNPTIRVMTRAWKTRFPVDGFLRSRPKSTVATVAQELTPESMVDMAAARRAAKMAPASPGGIWEATKKGKMASRSLPLATLKCSGRTSGPCV